MFLWFQLPHYLRCFYHHISTVSLSVSQGLDIVMTWEEISCPLLLSLWAWCNVSLYRNYDSWPKSKLQNTSQFSCLITALLQFHASLLLWELNVFCEDVVYGTGFVLLCWQPAEVLGENPKHWDCRATVRRELFFSFGSFSHRWFCSL